MLLSQHTPNLIEAGFDEVGRGCLAGPVVAAAVILPKNYTHELLNDSKKLSARNRIQLVDEIKSVAISYGIGVVDNFRIDEINILNATYEAMHFALDQLQEKPELLLIDGNRFRTTRKTPYECVIKGDGKYLSIAAASILAKTYRDDLMTKLSTDFPGYGWENNVGYPTKAHREGIKKLGITSHHRKSFNLLPSQGEIFK